MGASATLSFGGTPDVEILDTGSGKRRFSVVLTIRADGKFIKTAVIFKNLKKVLKIKIPPNMEVFVSDGGSMNLQLMLNIAKTFYR